MKNGAHVSPHEIVSDTVIYTVRIIGANPGAWYRDLGGRKFDCLLEIVEKQFGGQQIMFRVLRSYFEIRYIKPSHCEVVNQHFATHQELTTYYGNAKR